MLFLAAPYIATLCQVYANVCATCHSMNLLAYRNFVDNCYTEDEVRTMCEDVEVTDGPNDEGEMFERPAKLSDNLISPYPNEQVRTCLFVMRCNPILLCDLLVKVCC